MSDVLLVAVGLFGLYATVHGLVILVQHWRTEKCARCGQPIEDIFGLYDLCYECAVKRLEEK